MTDQRLAIDDSLVMASTHVAVTHSPAARLRILDRSGAARRRCPGHRSGHRRWPAAGLGLDTVPGTEPALPTMAAARCADAVLGTVGAHPEP